MIHTYIYIYFDVDPSKLYIVSWNDRDREWKKKKCAKEREIAVVETLTPSVFVLRHLFLNSLPLISTRRRPTFPLFNLLRSSVSRNNVSSPIEWRFFVLFFGCSVYLSLWTRSFVGGARVSRTAATNVTGFANIVLPSCIGSVIRCCGTMFRSFGCWCA